MSASGKAKHHHTDSAKYTPVYQDEHEHEHDDVQDQTPQDARPRTKQYPTGPLVAPPPPPGGRYRMIAMASCIVILVAANLYLSLPYAFAGGHSGYRNDDCPVPPSDLPQYFRTSPNPWPGPTATGAPAFLAQTRVLPDSATFVPNEPLQTSMPIRGAKDDDESVFRLMAFLSPYFPSPGFGVDEYPLPDGAEIVQVHMLSRHGSRYPTAGSDVVRFGNKVAGEKGKATFQKELAFLRDWKYELGNDVLVPKGRQELFDSGVLHGYMYGKLYDPEAGKIIVRTTTQDRMLKSAENWLAGFFGLDWRNNATIEVLIEGDGFNNSLAGYLNCPNAETKTPGYEAPETWIGIYLKDAVSRFNAMSDDFEWTPKDVYAAQTMCPYETVAYGFSKFCDLFTYEEWQGFGYSVDLSFSSTNGFHSPTGRAIGIGYQQELMARLKNTTLGYSHSQINVTLDSDPATFPLDQSLYFDFSHDTNIVSVLTALGLRQFADDLPATHLPNPRNFTVSHITPFGARLDIEVIKSPRAVAPQRDDDGGGGGGGGEEGEEGEETRYVHFVLNQRTVPLGRSFPECDAGRKDGWCELETFIRVQEEMADRARYDFACFGDYEAEPYGKVTDGAPNQRS
ncbi:3-phytase A precursor [Cordyceps fumosorosea ARSEF 2679]|uniref:3-phytase n=1 Tax=Cordyceps fumosorosea (strain ARSEF 2679) TaxID=1081104 RepID=A0A168E0V6_CORFA|nr:3-phytase A precursor [Cordyceps fumosorosea ARSEF 2679]OAA73243.1 3-phytase A precursor [Cordyceps fumosorosea ARSEF 2679]